MWGSFIHSNGVWGCFFFFFFANAVNKIHSVDQLKIHSVDQLISERDHNRSMSVNSYE